MKSAVRQAAGAVSAIGSAVNFVVAGVMILLVKCYQWTLSPFIGRQCRFEPTCSHYFIGAVKKYGPWSGAIRGVLRICRCHPWHRGGYDPP